jgi:hypothetical protein
LLKAWPDLPTTVIAERIGWIRSVRVLRKRVSGEPRCRTVAHENRLRRPVLWPVWLAPGTLSSCQSARPAL